MIGNCGLLEKRQRSLESAAPGKAIMLQRRKAHSRMCRPHKLVSKVF